MLNLNNVANVIADNEVAINGVVIGKLTDADAQRIIDIVKGFMSQTASTPVASVNTSKKTSKGKKLIAGWHIEEHNNLFCISRGEMVDGKRIHAGWTKAEKAVMNNAIKSLPDIVTTRVTGDTSWNAWGYADEKTAIEMMQTLPTEFVIEA